ncbi:MAG TPA: DUF5719 family protein [Actinomycetota bacterium]|nr:DUF5719 family protein [Actinomycetota bacterium]
MRKLQPLVALLVPVALLAGAAYADRDETPRTFAPENEVRATSGAWFCPHGGGPQGWEVRLQVANPGERSATVRVLSLDGGKPGEPETFEVPAGGFVQIPVGSRGRERSSMVEWFGQWVAVGWLAHAGGDEGGVAAEPCAPAAGGRWFLPDGTTDVERDHDYVVVMNPFAREAVFSITLLSERKEPVRHGSLTDVALRPLRSVAFDLGDVVLGEPTVSALVEVSVGRVAAATLGVSDTGGIRSALGYLGTPPATLTFPGGEDAGRTELVVMSAGAGNEEARVSFDGDILVQDGPPQVFAGLAEASMPAAARTFPSTTSGPTSVRFTVSGQDIAAVRRTFGVVSDQASVTGALPASSWIVLPAVAGEPSNPGLVLANPGIEPAVVTLSFLSPGPAEQISVSVPPDSTVEAPERFLRVAPEAGVRAEARSGTFIPAAASYSLGHDGFATYAVALGIAIPEGVL